MDRFGSRLDKPVIGISTNLSVQKGKVIEYLSSQYAECIRRAGGLPLVIPTLEVSDDAEMYLDVVDGVVLTAGKDLDPRRDGFMLHPTVNTYQDAEAVKETSDRWLANAIADTRKSVFGIGRGMQLLNVTLGGNLYLDIKEDLPNSIPHIDQHDPGHRHSLEVMPGTLLERSFGDGEIRVTSRHHMAIDELAPGFTVSGRSPDGVIEAIESEEPEWFAIGTQFHPHSEHASALELRIFEEFIDGVKMNGLTNRIWK